MEKIPICRRIDGKLIVLQETLDKIQEIPNYDSNIPVAIFSFIGRKGSGKTIYTNLLIQNLRNNSTGGWLDKVDANSTIKNDRTPLPGFLSGFVEEENYSEICLWPEVFLIQCRGKPLMVLLLDINYSASDPRSDEADSLEVFLSLVCSKIVEIHWEFDEFRFLQIYGDLKDLDDNVYGEAVCNSVVYLVRRNAKPLGFHQHTYVEADGVKALRNMINCKKTRAALEDLKSAGIAFIPTSPKSLLNSRGHLKLTLEMYNAISQAINLLADDEHNEPKIITCSGQLLLGGSLIDFIHQCVENCNTVLQRHEAVPIFSTVECQKPSTFEEGKLFDGQLHVENDTMHAETNDFENQSSTKFSPDKETNQCFKAVIEKHPHVFDQQEEHDPSNEILQILQLVVKAAEERLPHTLSKWNMRNSNFRCSEVLAKCLQEGCSTLHEKLDTLKKEEIIWLLDAATTQIMETNTDLCKIEDILHSFNSNLTGVSLDANALHLLLRVHDLENEILQSNMLQAEFARKLVLDICNNCILQYMNENRSTDVFLLSLEKMRSFYTEEMKQYLEMGPFNKKSFSNFHTSLTRRCISAVITVMSWYLDSNLSQYDKQIGRICKQRLNADFNIFQKTNMKILNMVNKKLTSLIAKSKVKYDEKIVEAVNNKVSMDDLQKVHISAKDNALQFLKDRIQEVRMNEPIMCHEFTLQAIIDSDWCLLRKTYST